MQSESYNSYVLLKNKLLMATEELPSSFDLIVIGTGLEESIVAAAASRNGHTVLHLDINSYYGSQWSSFSLDGIMNWADSLHNPEQEKENTSESDFKDLLKDDENFIRIINSYSKSFENIHYKWHINEKNEENLCQPKNDNEENLEINEESTETICQSPIVPEVHSLSRETLMMQSKRFSLDLFPHLLFSRGPMVELLIKSNISRYTEFKSISRILTELNGKLELLPSSRSDVFSTKHISVIEKRLLMKFMSFCVNYNASPETFDGFADKSFLEFLESQKLTENIKNFVLSSIAMVDDKTGCLDGLESTKKFLSSLGRFGNSPFLWPMYGSGEMPQAFCRLCAVFGGVYNLDRPIDGLVIKDNKVVAIVSRGQRIDCKFLVINSELCPQEVKSAFKETRTRRKIIVSSDSILPSPTEHLSFLSLSPKLTGSDNFVFVHEVGYAGAICPRGYICLFLTMPISGTKLETDESIQKAVDIVAKDNEKVIWEINFDIRSEIFESVDGSSKLSNLFVCSGPAFEIDFDRNVSRAEEIFKSTFPDEDFLPRAPDPDEIIIGDYDDEPTA